MRDSAGWAETYQLKSGIVNCISVFGSSQMHVACFPKDYKSRSHFPSEKWAVTPAGHWSLFTLVVCICACVCVYTGLCKVSAYMNGACQGDSTCTGTTASCGCAGLGCCLSQQADIKSLEGQGGATLQLQVASWQGWHRGSSQGKGPRPHEREAVDEQKERGPGRVGAGTLITLAHISTQVWVLVA